MAKRQPNPTADHVRAEQYRRHKSRAAERQAEMSRSGRDLGQIPPIVDPARRAACREDFRRFCEEYFPDKFRLGWSPDHLKAIARIEDAVLRGGLFALAMPRGSGKTTLCETAVLWCLVYGHRPFTVLVGSDLEAARGNLDNIKIELATNDLLLADFPEVCHPLRQLAGAPNTRQMYQGERTYVVWHTNEIVLPIIPGSAASGCRVRVRGITGRIRGMKAKLPGGGDLRPSLVVIDDPQTEESANSEPQCRRRLAVLCGAILGLAGPGATIAGVMPCTVIVPGDVADTILDREKFPQWQGLRTKLVYAWPTEKALWEEYLRIRADSLRAGHGGREATEFYAAHRAAMDAGSQVAWEARFAPGEISALQHAFNLRMDMGEEAFQAEFQNDPVKQSAGPGLATADQVRDRINGRLRGEVPLECEKLTAFGDIHDRLLYWMVCAWQPGMTGYVVDYGTLPDQDVPMFHLVDCRRTLRQRFPGAGPDGAILAGLEALVLPLLARDWPKAGGGVCRIDKLLLDMGYKRKLAWAVKHKAGGNTIELSKGLGIKAGNRPIADYTPKPGEVFGDHWYRPAVKGAQEFPHVRPDTNHWKSWIHEHLLIAPGDPGALTVFGRDPNAHELLAQHISDSETFKETFGHGRTVREWTLKPNKPDNHWFDCIVGCAVAASLCGLRQAGEPKRPRRPTPPRQNVRYL